MKILHCDCCHAEVNDYSHWYNDAQPRNMYELKCVHESGSDTYNGMIICHECIEKLLHKAEGSSADEAIDVIKRYDEKQNCIERCCKNCKHSDNGMVGSTERCESCYYDGVSKANTLFEPMETDNSKIEVGDEVKRADIDKSLVIIKFTEEGWALGMNEEGNISDVKLSVYKKTGKHFDQIAEVFNSLKGDIDA